MTTRFVVRQCGAHILLVLGAIVLAPISAHAQEPFPADIRPGARVRVWIPDLRQEHDPERRQLLRGTVESVDARVLHLTVPGTAGSLSIARSSVRRLDISRGVSRGASMIERAAGGAASGAILFALMNDPKRTGGPHYRRDWRAAGVGAEWGAGLGLVVGYVFPYEQWRRVIH